MYVLPLILSFLLSGSSDYIDGFLVTSHFGSDAFAIFRYGAREFPVSLLLANALSTAMVPALSIHKTEQEGFDQLKKSSLRLMHFLFPLTIALMLSSTYLYPLIFRKEFMESAPIFNVYLLLIVSRMIFPQTVVMAKQSTGIVFKIAIIEIIVNVLASYLLMLKFGIIGVAWGTVIAYYTEKLFLSGYLYKVYGLQLGSYTPVKVWTFYTLLVFTTYLFVENFA
jgi:O-antigen/teichoic acid export membrane protein